MIDLSIILPVYNTPKVLLSKCLSSVKMNVQEFGDNIEVLLINDGSTETYIEEILKACEQEDSHFRYVYKQNGGVSDARNLGVFYAKHDYIAFVDSDDYLEPNAIKYMLDVTEEKKADLTIFGVKQDHTERGYDHYTRMLNSKEKEMLLVGLISEINESMLQSHGFILFTSCGKIYKKEILQRNKIKYDVRIKYSEDSFFNFCYITIADKIFMDNKQVYHYVTNKESATTSFTFQKAINLPILLTAWENFILNHYPRQEKMLNLLCTRTLEEIRGVRYQYFTHPQNVESFWKLRSEMNLFFSTPPIDKWIKFLRFSHAKDIVSFKNILLLKTHLYWLYLIIERNKRKKLM